MSAPLQGTASAATAIARVHYTHEAMIDLMISNPELTQIQLGKVFGYTGPWVSRIVNSDAFQARLAERKADLVDPMLRVTLDEKLRAMADQSLAIVMDKLAVTQNPDTALKALDLATRALGFGARNVQQNNVQQNFVVAMPSKVENATEWAARAMSQGAGAGSRSAPPVPPMSPDLLALVERVE